MRKAHAAQYIRRLAELDVVVTNDLYPVPPRVKEVEKPSGQRLDARIGQRPANRLLVVDHQPEMAAIVGALLAALLERKELIAEIDESRRCAFSAQLELEQAALESERLLDVTDLERDMIEADGACFSFLRHANLRGSR